MAAYFIFCFILLLFHQSEAQWSYSGPKGPSNWWRLPGAQACHGRKQSPININTFETGQKNFPPFLFENYGAVPRGSATRITSMVNMGHTIQINLEGNYFVSGGGLPNKYKAITINLHWGSDNSKGSEHKKNGMPYPAEMQIVHYNHVKYRTLGDAMTKPKGLAVLGFWFKLGRHNSAWDPIINNLKQIKYANKPYIFTQPYQLASFLPSHVSRFYRYDGSLTTPGCYESVIWTMFDNEIILSRAQLAKLRQLSKFETPPYGPGAGPELHRRLVDNFRPIQRLWFRTVYQSWPHASYDYNYGAGAGVGAGGGAGGGVGTGTVGMTPKVEGQFPGMPANGGGAGPGTRPGVRPGTEARNGIRPARFEEEEEDELAGNAQMEAIFNNFMNGAYGNDADFLYYEDTYGNINHGADNYYQQNAAENNGHAAFVDYQPVQD